MIDEEDVEDSQKEETTKVPHFVREEVINEMYKKMDEPLASQKHKMTIALNQHNTQEFMDIFTNTIETCVTFRTIWHHIRYPVTGIGTRSPGTYYRSWTLPAALSCRNRGPPEPTWAHRSPKWPMGSQKWPRSWEWVEKNIFWREKIYICWPGLGKSCNHQHLRSIRSGFLLTPNLMLAFVFVCLSFAFGVTTCFAFGVTTSSRSSIIDFLRFLSFVFPRAPSVVCLVVCLLFPHLFKPVCSVFWWGWRVSSSYVVVSLPLSLSLSSRAWTNGTTSTQSMSVVYVLYKAWENEPLLHGKLKLKL